MIIINNDDRKWFLKIYMEKKMLEWISPIRLMREAGSDRKQYPLWILDLWYSREESNIYF